MQPFRPFDDDAQALLAAILSGMRHATLGTLDPQSGAPHLSRIAVQWDADGVPMALLSGLAAHSRALAADPRAGLLIGLRRDKGDPMTHPRLSVQAHATRVPGDAKRRSLWLAADPKAAVYIDLPDFSFWRLEPLGGLLNGGFGKAWQLEGAQIRATPTG